MSPDICIPRAFALVPPLAAALLISGLAPPAQVSAQGDHSSCGMSYDVVSDVPRVGRSEGPIALRGLIIMADFPDGIDKSYECGGETPWPNGSTVVPDWMNDVLQDVGEPLVEGSLTQYYDLMTHGQIDLRGVTYDKVIQMPMRIEDYNREYVLQALGEAIIDVIEKVDADPTVDFSEFDMDGDEEVDYVFVLFRETRFLYAPPPPDDPFEVAIKYPGGQWGYAGIGFLYPRSHTFVLDGGSMTLPYKKGSLLTPATCILNFDNIVEIAAHEFGHAQHPYSEDHTPHNYVMGMYDLMHGTTGWRGAAAYMSTLRRWADGWIEPVEYIKLGVDLLAGQEMEVVVKDVGKYPNEGFVVIEGETSPNVFVLEGRDPSATVFTRGTTDPAFYARFPCEQWLAMCDIRRSPEGVLISHATKPTTRIVDVEIASGRFDLVTLEPDAVSGKDEVSYRPSPWPGATDIAAAGSDHAAFQPGEVFGPYTNPSSNFTSSPIWSGPQDTYSGLTVYDFEWINPPGVNGEGTMRFKIRYDGETPPSGPHVLASSMNWGGTIQLMGDVEVPQDGTLRVRGGTWVVAADEQDVSQSGLAPNLVEIVGSGDIRAVGIQEGVLRGGPGLPIDDVIFTHSSDPEYRAKLGWIGSPGGFSGSGWQGLRFLQDATLEVFNCGEIVDGYTSGSRVEHVEMRHALTGVHLEGTGAPVIKDVTFDQSHIYLDNTDVYIPLVMNQCQPTGGWDLDETAEVVASMSSTNDIPGRNAGIVDIVAHGQLNVAAPNPVVSFRPEHFTPGGSSGYSWGGIDFDFRSQGSSIVGAEVGNCLHPLHFEAPDGDVVDNTTVSTFGDCGIWAENATGSGITIQNSTVQRGFIFEGLPDNGTVGIRLTRSSVATVTGNTVDMSSLTTAANDAAGIRLDNDAAFCQEDPGSVELQSIADNAITGAGSMTPGAALDLIWSCGVDNYDVLLEGNNVDGWHTGLRLVESADLQLSCNVFTDVTVGADISSTQWPSDPGARFLRNHFVADDVCVQTDNGLKTKLGPSGLIKGKNVFEVEPAGAVLSRTDPDPGTAGTLNARGNSWKVGGAFLQDEAEVRAHSVDNAAGVLVALVEADDVRFDTDPNCDDEPIGDGLRDEDGDPSEPSAISRRLAVHPNPMRSGTTIQYSATERGRVSIHVYDVQGRRVRGIIDQVVDPGSWQIAFDGSDDTGRPLARGVYFVQLKTPEGVQTKRVSLVR